MSDTSLKQQNADLSHAPAGAPATATIVNDGLGGDSPEVTPPPQRPEVNPEPATPPETNPDLQPEIPPVENPDI